MRVTSCMPLSTYFSFYLKTIFKRLNVSKGIKYDIKLYNLITKHEIINMEDIKVDSIIFIVKKTIIKLT